MKALMIFGLGAAAFAAASAHAGPIDVPLGTATSFAVLAGASVTNTGATVIDGDLGAWPGAAVTGVSSGIVNGGSIHAADTIAEQAQSDLATAYAAAAGDACASNLSGQDLGGLTLTPGVYCFSSTAQLTGTLTLNALNDADAVFVFQIGTTLITASQSLVDLVNDAAGGHVYWQVGSAATLGPATDFAGTILAQTSITLDTGADIACGRALAVNGAVTMDDNAVNSPSASCGSVGIPEPGSSAMMATGVLLAISLCRRRALRR
jgi:type VI secretion system secreted protein VgrG